MTGQVPDKLIYNKSSYSIVGLKGEGLPSPFDFGLEPISPNTANWRGFVMTYLVVGKHLNVHEMNVSLKDIRGKPPVINEVNPELEKSVLIHLTYKNLKLKTQFTGEILIAKDFIDSMYIHMGFQSPISFETVFELEFKKGELISTLDLSKQMKKYREQNITDGKLGPYDDLKSWIARTFSLDYDF